MSQIDNFESDLPLTPKKLIQWIEEILLNIDTYTIDYSLFEQICACNSGSNVTSIVSTTLFDSLHEAIADNTTIEISTEGKKLIPCMTWVQDVVSDNFYSFGIAIINSSGQYVKIVISKMDNSIYLDTKTVTTLGG